jgi:hypothetical protein
MFYYISFLRPPPLQASTTPTEPILIMPQICNDLRTEYLDDPIDIYYAWSLHAPHPTSPMTTKPTKLTSWRTSTAYKEIPVPKPPHLDSQNHKWKDSDGSSWRLILTCGTTQNGNDQAVVLGETDTTGRAPFAVMSMPVRFSRRHGPGNLKGAVKGTKQERIARSYALRVPLQDRPIVFDIMEQTSFDLDKVRPPPHVRTLASHQITAVQRHIVDAAHGTAVENMGQRHRTQFLARTALFWKRRRDWRNAVRSTRIAF